MDSPTPKLDGSGPTGEVPGAYFRRDAPERISIKKGQLINIDCIHKFSCHWLQVNKGLKEISHNLISGMLSQRLKGMIAVALVGVDHVRSCDAKSTPSDMMRTGSAESILTDRSPVQC